MSARPLGAMLTLAAWLVGVYVALLGALYLMQRSLLFPASQFRPAPAQRGVSEMQVINVRTRDGLDLVAWYHPAPAGRLTVLSFHGNGAFIGVHADLARKLIDAGYGVLLASYRGYSGNPGSPSEAGLYDDGRAAMDFLVARNAPVVLHGASLGAAVAVQLATERPVRGLIAETPFTSAADVAAAVYFWMPVRLLMRDPFESLAKYAVLQAPVLLIHGTRDEVVPAAQFDRVYAAITAPKRRVVIDGASHNDLWDHDGGRAALSFLDALTRGEAIR